MWDNEDTARKEVRQMLLQSLLTAIGRRISVFKNEAGEPVTVYIGNASQNNGEIITEVRLNKEQYDSWERGHEYRVTCKYGKGRTGGYLQILDVSPVQQGK